MHIYLQHNKMINHLLQEVRAKQEEEVESLKGELQEITKRITKLNKNIDKATAATEQVCYKMMRRQSIL